MWEMAKNVKAGAPIAEFHFGFTMYDIQSQEDVEMLLGLGWQGSKFYMEWRDGRRQVKGIDYVVPLRPDPEVEAEWKHRQDAYDRLDARLSGE